MCALLASGMLFETEGSELRTVATDGTARRCAQCRYGSVFTQPLGGVPRKVIELMRT